MMGAVPGKLKNSDSITSYLAGHTQLAAETTSAINNYEELLELEYLNRY